MKYLALIYAAPNSGPEPGTPEHEAFLGQYFALTQGWAAKGLSLAGEALEDVSNATSIRVREGKVQTIDGPFAETKEHLGGFYLFDCANLDEALKEAAKIPTVEYGTIEVRPVFDYSTMMPA